MFCDINVSELITFTSVEVEAINKKILSSKNPKILASNFKDWTSKTIQFCQTDRFECNDNFGISVESAFFATFHDSIMAVLYRYFQCANDDIFYETVNLQNVNITPINLPASTVELAHLDAEKTVLEKMICLCTCYDLIYAEIKAALVEFIAEEDKLEIPVVENKEIIAAIMQVIIKSKMKKIHSNLCFIEMFSNYILKDKHCRHVLDCFKQAVICIRILSEKDCKDENVREISLIQYYQILNSSPDEAKMENKDKLLVMKLKKVANLITKSVTV